jgi:hypothetical protein
MAEELAPVIQAQGVGAEESTHPLHKVAIGRFDHQMKVIAHQAKGMDLKTCLLAGLRQGLEEILTIHIVVENVFAPIPTAHDVVHGSRILDAQLARHEDRLNRCREAVK